MTFSDLKNNYTSAQLGTYPGDVELRRTLFAPLLQNLYENKVVYYERLMCVARIEELIITPELFRAKASVHLRIDKKASIPPNWEHIEKGWHFGAKWEALSYHNNSFGMFYSPVVFITDPEFVKMIETLVLEGQHNEAARLIFQSA